MENNSATDNPLPHGKAKPKRPWRDNLEAIGIAILIAVLLKPLVIEAYQIPTPSMQPTMMGSKAAGVHDRLLVDKMRYAFTEPKRFDIAVFRYPVRRNQNYVKRIIGLPGDRLRIAGGNIYQVTEDGEVSSILRKPDQIQRGLWKEIYPLRRTVKDDDDILGVGHYFSGFPGKWKQEGDDLVGERKGGTKMRVSFGNLGEGGLSNQIYDGYGPDVAKAIKQTSAREYEGVQDARFSFVITPSTAPAMLRVQITAKQVAKADRRFELKVEGGKGHLTVILGGKEKLASEPFDFPVTGSEPTEISFAHVDDRLVAWRDGEQVAELEVGDFRMLTQLEPGKSSVAMEVEGVAKVRLSSIRVERDLHWVKASLPEGHTIEVPDGHYFMLGDNTLASADARMWKVIAAGVLDDGRMVDQKQHPEAHVIRGNKRPWALDDPPDVDENPVVLRRKDQVVFTDNAGEVHLLHSAISSRYGSDPQTGELRMVFQEKPLGGATAHPWEPSEEPARFVPRKDILGRPVLGFWPIWPFGPNRFGFIR